MKHQTMHFSEIIELLNTFRHIVREYLPIDKISVGGSGFYSYYDDKSHQTHILVTLDTLLEIVNLHFQQHFDSFTITTDSEPIDYRKGTESQILVGFRSILVDDYDEGFWCQTTFDELPDSVGFCEKSV